MNGNPTLSHMGHPSHRCKRQREGPCEGSDRAAGLHLRCENPKLSVGDAIVVDPSFHRGVALARCSELPVT